jgi:hypothetical protein
MLTDRLFVEESVPASLKMPLFPGIDLASSASPCNLEPREYGYQQGKIRSRLLQAGVRRQLEL